MFLFFLENYVAVLACWYLHYYYVIRVNPSWHYGSNSKPILALFVFNNSAEVGWSEKSQSGNKFTLFYPIFNVM